MPPIKTKTSVGLETPDQTVERANKLLQPTISASDLTTPTTPVTVPEPQVGSLPQGTSQIVSNVTRDMNGFIAAQTQEAADLKKRQQEYAQLTNQGSLQDLFTSTMEGAGVNQNTLKELKDIQLQLADNKTASELTKTQIAGADGQTLVQGQREITQEDREAAVRSTGLAARASVIQGNIETATQLARDTVNIAYQDRTLTSQNLLNQIEMLQGQVDDQTGQLLEQEKRQYEADLAAVEELKRATQNAIVSGASQSEISQLTDPKVDDQTKLQLAQSITARGATEMRNLDIYAKQSQLYTNSLEQQKLLKEIQSTGELPTEIIEQDGKKLLVNTQTGEIIKDFGASNVSMQEVVQEQAAHTINSIDNLFNDPGKDRAVGAYTLSRWTPLKVDKSEYLNFIGTVDQLTKELTIDKLVQAKNQGISFGALSDTELGLIAESASKINSWRKTDETGKTLFYEIDEASFDAELDNINNFKKLNAVLQGTDPAMIGVQQMPDGSYWTTNSDGSYVQIRK